MDESTIVKEFAEFEPVLHLLSRQIRYSVARGAKVWSARQSYSRRKFIESRPLRLLPGNRSGVPFGVENSRLGDALRVVEFSFGHLSD